MELLEVEQRYGEIPSSPKCNIPSMAFFSLNFLFYRKDRKNQVTIVSIGSPMHQHRGKYLLKLHGNVERTTRSNPVYVRLLVYQGLYCYFSHDARYSG